MNARQQQPHLRPAHALLRRRRRLVQHHRAGLLLLRLPICLLLRLLGLILDEVQIGVGRGGRWWGRCHCWRPRWLLWHAAEGLPNLLLAQALALQELAFGGDGAGAHLRGGRAGTGAGGWWAGGSLRERRRHWRRRRERRPETAKCAQRRTLGWDKKATAF